MELRALRYFVMVAEEGSVHAGARRAMIAQPALTVALKKLEREIGGSLFERSYKGVSLTAAGAALLPRARHILRYVDQAGADTVARPPDATREFSIGLVEGRVAAAELTGPIVAAFQKANPHLRVTVRPLDFVEQFDCVLDGLVDVAIVRSPYEHPDLAMEPLFGEPTLLVASPEHKLADRREVELDAVLDEPMLEVVRTPQRWREFWNLAQLRNGERRSIPSTAVCAIDFTLDVLRNAAISPMAKSGFRLTQLGQWNAREIELIDAPLNVIGIGYRPDHNTAEVQSFINSALATVAECIGLIPGGELIAPPER